MTALNKERAEKTLSLNLKVRQQQRTQLDEERLERANQRLIAEGQPPAKSVEDLDSAGAAVAGDGADGSASSAAIAAAPAKRGANNAAPSKANTPPDLVLGEATQVMADILTGNLPNQRPPASAPAQQTVKR